MLAPPTVEHVVHKAYVLEGIGRNDAVIHPTLMLSPEKAQLCRYKNTEDDDVELTLRPRLP